MLKNLLCVHRHYALLLLAVLPFYLVASESPTHKINVNVTVIAPPPCVINNNRSIDVDFGDVLTTKVDGNNYKIPVEYTLTCTKPSKNLMSVKISGTAASFNNTALKTNLEGLGIQIISGGTAYIINNDINFTYPNIPKLQAVPIRKNGVTLSGGTFSSVATLSVSYQ